MSTIDRERSRVVPPLVDGERLDRATFHERYEAMPPETRAELVGGVVVMPSPVRSNHGWLVARMTSWACHFARDLEGLYAGCDATVFLDELGVPQPDVQLLILPEFGGQSRRHPQGYIDGAPELVIEVAGSSRPIDLGPKREDYQRAGVREYVVVTLEPADVHWLVLRDGGFVPLAPGEDGVFRSEVFPGLWLDEHALFASTLAPMLETLERGRATPEFAAFAAALRQKGAGR